MLTSLTKKDSPDKLVGVWGEPEQKAFDLIKQAMVDVEVLKFLDYNQPICIRTDASTDGCGAMLYQNIGGQEQPVAYLSKTFSTAERRWSTIEQETYAVYWAITSWDSYTCWGSSLKCRLITKIFCGCTRVRLLRFCDGDFDCRNMTSL